jgi:hypothetical protein
VTDFIERADVDEGIEHLEQNASVGTLGQRESDSQLTLEDSASYTAYGDDGLPRVVYAQVTEAEFQFSQYITVTYWMFYFHDPKKAGSELLSHQSDFESVTILINDSGAQYIGGSQHFGGERRRWQNIRTTNETHPHIYPALGSHSVYFVNTDRFSSPIIGQDQHLSEDSNSIDPVYDVWQDPLYVDQTGNSTIWAHEDRGPDARTYELRRLTGNESWQAYRGSFMRSLTRDALDSKSVVPAQRQRWKSPGKWMESLPSYRQLVSPQVGWGFFTFPSSRGSIQDSSVTVTPKIWKKGPLPTTLYIKTTVRAPNGTVIGSTVTTLKRSSGKPISPFDRPTATITTPVSTSPEEVNVSVAVYRQHPPEASAPVQEESTTVCDGFFCGLL